MNPFRHAELVSASIFALASASALQAQPATGHPASVDYSSSANWLCLPGRTDACSKPLATTELTTKGYGAAVPRAVAKDPPIDCFYVYPTVSHDQGMNSDLKASEEIVTAKAQFARFASVCKTYAPLYRQMTISSIATVIAGGDVKAAGELAYSDVANAWKTYLAKYNRGRPFVLIGHSQGSLMLQELIKRQIEGSAVAKRMVRAIIPGYNVLVPQGKLVGGTFKSTPLCSSDEQTGCVMAWSSFRERNQPPEGAMFGWSPQPGMTVGCTNPAHAGSTGWETLDSYWYPNAGYSVAGGPITWSSEGPPPTPFLETKDLVQAKCVTDGRLGYLSVRTVQTPGGERTNRIGGEVGLAGLFLPGWGMHMVDLDIGQGDLVGEIGSLSEK